MGIDPQNGQEEQPWANPGRGPQDAAPWQQPDQPQQQPTPQPTQPGQSPQAPQPGQQWSQPGPQPAQWPQSAQNGQFGQPTDAVPPWPQPGQQAGYPPPQGPVPPGYQQGLVPPGYPQGTYSGAPGQQYWPGMRPGMPPGAPWGLAPKPRSTAKVGMIIAAVAAVVAVGVIGAVVAAGGSNQSSPTALASAQSSSTASSAASTDSGTGSSATGSASASSDAASGDNPLTYEASGTPARAGIGIPTFNAAAAEKDYTVTFHTNRGDIVVDMNGKAAPYTVYSFVYLAEKDYFNDTKCHRLTTTGIYVLQCGDPTGSGTGGPGYTIPDENLASLGSTTASEVTYPAGIVAMANTGQAHTGGSQFFIVYQDSPLAPTYTPFGTVTQGLGIIRQVAAAGTDNSYGSGDGAPNDAVQLETVTVS